MTDWGSEPPYSGDQIKALDIEGDLSEWYWVLNPNGSFTGDVGILHFTNGKAAYAPQYIFSRGKADWFLDAGGGNIELNPDVGKPPLWVLLWCWRENGFTVTPMNGGQAEYDELIPVEGMVSESPGGGESATIGDMDTETTEAAAMTDGEEEVTSDG